jgi:hypothetical protein
MTTKKKRPRDLNELAASIVKDAIGEGKPEEEPASTKNPAAVALGRLGGLKGGKKRATMLSAERRKEIASMAAKARWEQKKNK